MLLFVVNWVLIFLFGILMFRVKKLHQSAGEQLRMEKLNAFYAMRDRLDDEAQNQTVIIPIHGTSTRLKLVDSASVRSYDGGGDREATAPLLQNNVRAVNYSTIIQNYYNDAVPR